MTLEQTAPHAGKEQRRRRSSDPYYALWMLCRSVADTHSLTCVTILDDFDNVIASTGDADVAGVALLNARQVSSDATLEARVREQLQWADLDAAMVNVARRFAMVSSQRDAFQVLTLGPCDALELEVIAEELVVAMQRILTEAESRGSDVTAEYRA